MTRVSAKPDRPESRPALQCFARNLCSRALTVLLITVADPLVTWAQCAAEQADNMAAVKPATSAGASRSVSSHATELAIDYGFPIAHFVGFSGERDSRVFNVEVEFDRHSWGWWLGARRDYVAELIPISLLRQPTVTDTFGDALSGSREWNPGFGFSPVGMRLLWRERQRLRPYLVGEPGVMIYSHPAMAPEAGHVAFIFQAGGGLDVALANHTRLRLSGSYLHISNGFIARENPGLDEAYFSTGFGFDLHKRHSTLVAAH